MKIDLTLPRPAGLVGTGATGAANAGASLGGTTPEGNSFADLLKQAVGDVNQLQLQSEQAGLDLAAGNVTDLHQVMILTEKADLALQLAIQVRNKVIEAYQEVMRMPV
ncbi:MAG TPA: flagellar hook-basal body complex protein FliE [Bacillota bacterium]